MSKGSELNAISTFEARIRPADAARATEARAEIERMGKARGRPLIYPIFPSGRGEGPYLECTDGRVILDMITGIGVNLFGYNHPDLQRAAADAVGKSPAMQGTLMPGREYLEVCERLLAACSQLPHLSAKARAPMAGCWLTTCGTMANELAVKIVRQKRHPAAKIITFRNAFAGRSTLMQEVTDEPKYREGQPTFDQVRHIDFYDDALSLDENVRRTQAELKAVLDSEPGAFGVFGFEPVQGEGGAFRTAPTAWWEIVLGQAREAGLGIWFDEVQTFGRTGEVFAFQRLDLGRFVDVVSCAKPLQAGAVLWTEAYAPKPGLIAGTFAGSTASLATGATVLKLLTNGGYLGHDGRIQRLERFIAKDWQERRARLGARFGLGRMNLLGGMVAFEVLDGKADTIKELLLKLLDRGLMAFSAGRDPVLLRMLPPVGVLTEAHWLEAMTILEQTLEAHYDKMKP